MTNDSLDRAVDFSVRDERVHARRVFREAYESVVDGVGKEYARTQKRGRPAYRLEALSAIRFRIVETLSRVADEVFATETISYRGERSTPFSIGFRKLTSQAFRRTGRGLTPRGTMRIRSATLSVSFLRPSKTWHSTQS